MRISSLVERHHGVSSHSAPVESIKAQLRQAGFVVVVKDEGFLGILTPVDLLACGAGSVGDCVRDLPAVTEDDAVAHVLEQMSQARTDVLPVFRDGEFVGIIREHRMAAHLAERLGDRDAKAAATRRSSHRQAVKPQRKRARRDDNCSPQLDGHEPLRKFFELDVVGMAIMMPDGAWIDVNERLCEMLGYSREELLQRRWPDLTHPEDLPDDLERVKSLLNGEIDSYSMEKRFIGPKGEIVHAVISVGCSRHMDGTADRVFACAVDITDRKRAEMTLRDREHKYRSLFESMKQGVVYQDADGHITSSNPAAEKILGLTMEQMRERTSCDPGWQAIRADGSVFPGAEHPAMVALHTGQEVNNVQMGVFNPRIGERVWINIHAMPQFRPGQDKPFEVYTTFEDITEIKKARLALEESEARFRELVELLPQTVFELDCEGFLTFANRIGLQLFGYEPQDLESLHVSQLFLPEDRERLAANVGRKLAGESFPAGDYMALTREGRSFPVTLYSTPIVRDNELVGLRGIVVDMSLRTEWEESLRQSEQRYRTIIETALDGVVEIDPDGRILEVNESYCAMTGYSRQELLQMTIGDLEATEIAKQVRAHIARVASLGYDRFESQHRRRDGTLVDVEIAAKVFDASRGHQIVFVRDITERKQTELQNREREAQFLHAGRLSTLGEMATEFAHELNQPLSAITAYSGACLRLAEAGLSDRTRIAENQKRIREQALRARDITRRVRTFAQRRPPILTDMALNETVENAVALVEWEMRQKSIGLAMDLAEEEVTIRADAVQIGQVIVNLLRNAIEATERVEGLRHITVETQVPNSESARIAVSDTGEGVAEESVSRLFDPFFTTKKEGLGIGLSISRKIIDLHGGTLEARPNEAAGMTFIVILPVAARR
jgi:PAS domain S-box-containing protein